MSNIIDFSEREKNEKSIQRTWAEFRQQLADKAFLYSDIDAALQSTFLRVFNDLFQHGHRFLEKEIGDVLTVDVGIVRAARIESGKSAPDYGRFIPKAEFITKDNRFSPPGVEWLYLAFAPKSSATGLMIEERCALKECRATAGEKFALCKFLLDDKYKKSVLIDLTVAKDSGYEDINSAFERCARQIVNREVSRGINGLTKVIVPRPQTKDIIPSIEQWAVYTYAKLLADQIFLPITIEDRTLMYAPFQCMAQYFLSKGYSGIVYSSTVYPEGKNVVLFNKQVAFPCGAIKNIIVPPDL